VVEIAPLDDLDVLAGVDGVEVAETGGLPALCVSLAVALRPVLQAGDPGVGRDLLALHAPAGATGHLAEQALSIASSDDLVGDGIGMALVGVARCSHTARQLDAGALLDDVRCLVRCGVEIRRARKRDVVAGRESRGTHVAAGLPSRAVGVRLDTADVEPPERALDRVKVGQAAAGPCVPRCAAS
jgi:hypothetical protein